MSISGISWIPAPTTPYCPKCKKALIVRDGYSISRMHLKGKECEYCGEEINIVILLR